MLRKCLKYFRLVYKKPLLLLRIIDNYFKIYILRMDVLRKVDICLTLRCPCSCDKCSSAKMYNSSRRELNPSEIGEIAKQCLELGAIQFNLTGGEPLLREDILGIIKFLQPQKVFISINTTGWPLNRELIEKLKAAGVDMIKMSLDSSVAAEHDKYRNSPGGYEKVMENLRYIKEVGGINSHISTVTIPDNIRSGKIFDILKIAEKFNSTLALTIPVPAGKWSDNYKILINGEDRKVLNKLLKNHLLVTEDIHASYRKVRCPAGTESMYITCYGDIIPCSVLQISFGNIRKEKLKDVYMKMLRFQPLRESVSVCKAGEVKCFINKWLKPISKSNLFPVEVSNHPSFSEEQNEAKESSNIQNTAF